MAFIVEVDRLSPGRIHHNALFRTYQSRTQFRALWNRDITVEQPELEIAVRYLSNDDNEQSAANLIQAWWWAKHDIDGDGLTLYEAVGEAIDLTEEKRRMYYVNKEARRLEQRRPTTKERVLEYLGERPGTAAQIADELHESRKAIGMCLLRLAKAGQVIALDGVYGVLRSKAA